MCFESRKLNFTGIELKFTSNSTRRPWSHRPAIPLRKLTSKTAYREFIFLSSLACKHCIVYPHGNIPRVKCMYRFASNRISETRFCLFTCNCEAIKNFSRQKSSSLNENAFESSFRWKVLSVFLVSISNVVDAGIAQVTSPGSFALLSSLAHLADPGCLANSASFQSIHLIHFPLGPRLTRCFLKYQPLESMIHSSWTNPDARV